ncbi:MAG: TonB family protein [Myxococcota bacterium]
MIQTTNRFLGAALGAATVTAALFWIMTALIRVENTEIPPEPSPGFVLTVFVEPEERPVEKIDRMPKLEEITPREVLPPIEPGQAGDGIQRVRFGKAPIDIDPRPGPLTQGSPDGDAVPLVRVPPRYPARALARGLEGRVLVEFTISRAGTVQDPRIVAFEPSAVFNQAALEAIRSWRYEPKRVNGRPVAQPGQRIVIPFQKDRRKE